MAAGSDTLTTMLWNLTNKRILLGVTGSIAAYKAAELVRRLREAGAEVRVAMTRAAGEFVTPLTFQALSGRPVHQDLLDAEAEAAMGHIELARWADAILVAPTSANFLARLAQGRADDLLSAICLAATVPLVLAPAMNTGMWQNAATEDNVRQLRARGVLFFGPDAGEQACGEVGPGRLLAPEELVTALAALFETGALAGCSVLVTAGPTREALDPVRYLSNHSSGRMGFAIAAAAAEAGARVTLVAGPVTLATPARVERVDVVSAQDMLEAVVPRVPTSDIFIACAAVADYRPRQAAAQKLKKSTRPGETLTLELEPCPDILATVCGASPRPFCVGFAAETEELAVNALAKLHRKGADMIAANWVGAAAAETGGGFASETNALQLVWSGGGLDLPATDKGKLARQLIAVIAERYRLYREKGSGVPDTVVRLKS